MDKLTHYRSLVKKLMTEYAEPMCRQAQDDVETATVFDDSSNQFMLVSVGWKNGHRIRATTIHVRLHSDKIWIEEDWTEEGFATVLLNAGVPADDIVLGFHSPTKRRLTEFAVA